MNLARLALVGWLTVGVGPLAAAVTGTEQRAAVLVYRQALHEKGASLTLTARLLTERAARQSGADASALAGLRDRWRDLDGGDTSVAGPRTVPGGASDVVAALVAGRAESAGGPAAPRLEAALAKMESGEGLSGLAPYLRGEARASAGAIWQAALERAADDRALARALAPLVRELTGTGLDAELAAWLRAGPPLRARDLEDADPGPEWRRMALSALASALANPGEVSERITARLRAQWYLASRDPAADPGELALTALWIGLRDNVAPLGSGDPAPFMSALLDGGRRLAAAAPLGEDVRSDLASGLARLRELPASMADDWNAVDTRLESLYGSVLAELARAASGEHESAPRLRPLLLAEARLTLLDEDWEAYLMQPFREPVQQALADCVTGGRDGNAGSCRNRFEDWALDGAGIPEAAGDVGGPFEPQYLLRETELNPWQRVNYLRGFWRMLLARECSRRDRVRNALEWALASRAYLAMVGRRDAGEDPAIAAGLGRLADAGVMMTRDLRKFAACRAQGRGPLRRTLSVYATAVNRLASALPEAAAAFGDEVLAPRADISLDSGPDQTTDYVPADLGVTPCGGTPSCGVSRAFPASAALYRRFPAPYRVADQSGMGSLRLCYGDVSWVDRRAEPVRGGGDVMANFHGRLSFRVRGRFVSGGEVRDVFVLRMATEREYPYLFGPDRAEVLADPCPREYQGRQAAGELPEARGWLVPRRLTYLSGERTSPARLFTENWTRGEQWLEHLATDGGAEVEEQASREALLAPLGRHLEGLQERRRAHLYELLQAPVPPEQAGDAARRLADAALEMAAMRRALDAGARVLIPRRVMFSPALRGSLYGDDALFGPVQVRAWRDRGRDPAELPEVARERLESAAPAWRQAADNAEMPAFVARTLIELMGARAALGEDPVNQAGEDDAAGASPRRTAKPSIPPR